MTIYARVMDKLTKESFFLARISSNQGVRTLYLFLNNICLLYCVIFQNLYVILIAIRFAKERGVVWEMLSRFLTCLGLAVSFNYAIFKYKTIREINLAMKNIYDGLKDERVPLKKFPSASFFISLGVVYTLLSEAAVALSFISWPSKNMIPCRDMWVQTLCVSGICDYKNLSEADKNMWFYVDLFLYTLATVASSVFVSTIYSYIVLSLISFSESMSASVRQAPDDDLETPLTRELLLKCRQYCQSIKHVLRLFNNVFSELFVIWYGVSLICTCAYCSQIMMDAHKENPLLIALNFFIYGQSFVSVAIVSWVSSKLPNMFNRALVEMQTLTLNRRRVSLDVFAELNILLSQIQTHPTGIEIGGCFLITKAFFVSYVGTILTFLMILFQLESVSKTGGSV